MDKVVSNLFKYGNSLQNVLIIRSDLPEHCRKNIISLAVTTFFHRKHSLGAPGHDHACQTFILIGPILCEVPVTLCQIGTWIRICPPSLSPNQWEDGRKGLTSEQRQQVFQDIRYLLPDAPSLQCPIMTVEKNYHFCDMISVRQLHDW